MKNLNDLLAGRDAAQHFLAQRFFFDARDETLRDLKIDIRLEQREAHLPQRIVDVRLADRAVTAQILEDVLKLIAELRKHALVQFAFEGDRGFDLEKFLSARRRKAEPDWHCRRGPRSPPERNRHRAYLFGEGDPVAAGLGAAPPSMAKLQCAWTFLPPDLASTTTVSLSRSFCVTWYEAVFVFASNDAGTTPKPLTRICTLPVSICPMAVRFALINGIGVRMVSPSRRFGGKICRTDLGYRGSASRRTADH